MAERPDRIHLVEDRKPPKPDVWISEVRIKLRGRGRDRDRLLALIKRLGKRWREA
jgi:hypothetical protein